MFWSGVVGTIVGIALTGFGIYYGTTEHGIAEDETIERREREDRRLVRGIFMMLGGFMVAGLSPYVAYLGATRDDHSLEVHERRQLVEEHNLGLIDTRPGAK